MTQNNTIIVYKPTAKAIRNPECVFTSHKERIVLHKDGTGTCYNGDKIVEALFPYRGKDSHLKETKDQPPTILYAYEAEFISIKKSGGLPFCDVVCDNSRFNGLTGVTWSPSHITANLFLVFDELDRLVSFTSNGRVWNTVQPKKLSEYGMSIPVTSHQGEKIARMRN